MASKSKAEEVQTVKLISSDKFEFIIDRKCALASGTIKNMLSSPGKKTDVSHLKELFKSNITYAYNYPKVNLPNLSRMKFSFVILKASS